MRRWRRSNSGRLVENDLFFQSVFPDTFLGEHSIFFEMDGAKNPNDPPVHQNQHAAPVRTLRDCMYPARTLATPGVIQPAITGNFELKPNLISLLPSFYGLDDENPYIHIRDFEYICRVMHYTNVSTEALYLRMFPFTLKDKAKNWYFSIPSGSITTWDELITAFIKRFYPHHKTAEIRHSLQTFKQEIEENLFGYMERFNELLDQCPHHGFPKSYLAQILYEGLDNDTRKQVETMSGGEFTSNEPDECYDIFVDLAEKTRQWESMREPKNRRNSSQRVSVNKVEGNSQITALMKRIEALESNKSGNVSNQVMSCNNEPNSLLCTICGDFTHSGPNCTLFNVDESQGEQCNAMYSNFQDQSRVKFDPYSNTYNPGWKHHPNFSWTKGVHQGGPSGNLPPGFSKSPAQTQVSSQFQQKLTSLEESLKILTQNTIVNNAKFDTFMETTQQCLQSNTRAISQNF